MAETLQERGGVGRRRVLLLATSDLHYRSHEGRAAELTEAARRVRFDCFVFAGDLSSGPPEKYRGALACFGRLSQPKIAVLGNHDLWVDHDGDSESRFGVLTPVFEEFGFSVLDAAPALIDGVAFVGGVGWYDYSFRARDPSFAEWVLVRRGDGSFCRWSELADEDYADKRLTYIDLRGRSGGPGRSEVTLKGSQWMDRHYIRWRYSDAEFTERCLRRLRADIERVRRSADEIVCVLHHVPFRELVVTKGEPAWDFANAFVGSGRFGRLLLEYSEVRTVICGHTHAPRGALVGHIHAFDVSDRSGGALYLVDTEAGTCERVFR